MSVPKISGVPAGLQQQVAAANQIPVVVSPAPGGSVTPIPGTPVGLQQQIAQANPNPVLPSAPPTTNVAANQEALVEAARSLIDDPWKLFAKLTFDDQLQPDPILFHGGTLTPGRTSDPDRARTLSEWSGRDVTAFNIGANRPTSVLEAAWNLEDCKRWRWCKANADAAAYAQEIIDAAAASPTEKVDVIAHSYGGFDVSVVLEDYPEAKAAVDSVLLLSPTNVVDSFGGVNVTVLFNNGDLAGWGGAVPLALTGPLWSGFTGKDLVSGRDVTGATVISGDFWQGSHDGEGLWDRIENTQEDLHAGWFWNSRMKKKLLEVVNGL